MASSSVPRLSSGVLTDIGRQRAGSVNQDAALALDLARGGLFAVADGMGGHAAGELAANLALETLSKAFEKRPRNLPWSLAEAVQEANSTVLKHAVGESVGMGTTLLALLIDKGAALVAHVGDSRAYLLREGELQRLTEDHSWVAEQVRQGFLTEEEAKHHQWKSVVSNALGGEERVRLELFGFPVKAGDRLLICSDGLSGVVEEELLARILSRPESPEHIARLMVDAANDGGGPDNITVVVVDITDDQPLPYYPLPTGMETGPEYLDILMSTYKGNGIRTYLLLSVIYFTLLGFILIPEYRWPIGVSGGVLLMMLFFGERFWRSRFAPKKNKAVTVAKVPPRQHENAS